MKKKLFVLVLALSLLLSAGLVVHADPNDPIPKSKPPIVVTE